LKKGHGTLIWKTIHKDQTQKGEFLGLTEKGNGTISYANGDVYTGYWMKDKRNGTGTIKNADGTELKGEWKED
jgi:hypothetical protein